jgi:TonB family protein
MLPESKPRKKKNSSKVNLLISFVFHAVLLAVLLFFAARSGILGKQFQKLTVQLVKAPPKPKPPPPPPRVEPPKPVETPKVAPKPVEEVKAPTAAPPVTAPPPELPAFDFDGGKAVDTSSDPVQIYRGALQFAFQSKWDRPNNMNDDSYVAEVQISVSRDGEISDPKWKKSSGNTTWDESVRKAIAAVKSLDRPPPTNFPPRVTIRFDVQEQSENVLQ